MGELFALAASLTFAVTHVVDKSLTKRWRPMTMASLESLGGMLFGLVVLLALGKIDDIQEAPLDSLLLSVLAGVISVGLGFPLYLLFLRSVDVNKASPLSFGLFVLLSTISGVFFLEEALSILTVVGIVVIVLGVYMLAFPQKGQSEAEQARWLGIRGILFLTLVASTWVIGNSIQREALRDLDVYIANAVRLPAVFLVLGIFALLGSRAAVHGAGEVSGGSRRVARPGLGGLISRSALLLIVNGVVSFGIAFLLMLAAFERVGIAITAALSSAEILWISLMSALFLRERWVVKNVVGILGTVTGVILVVL